MCLPLLNSFFFVKIPSLMWLKRLPPHLVFIRLSLKLVVTNMSLLCFHGWTQNVHIYVDKPFKLKKVLKQYCICIWSALFFTSSVLTSVHVPACLLYRGKSTLCAGYVKELYLFSTRIFLCVGGTGVSGLTRGLATLPEGGSRSLQWSETGMEDPQEDPLAVHCFCVCV